MKTYLSLILLMFSLVFSGSTQAVDVICNSSVDSTDLTQQQLRRIFTMRTTTWPDGSPIVVFVLSSKSITHQTFSKEVLQLFPYQLDRLWHKLSFSGMGTTPTQVNSIEAMQQAVAKTQGAIGYLDSYTKEQYIRRIEVKK